MNLFRPSFFLFFIALLLIGMASAAWAQRGRAYPTRPGFYIGGFGAHNSVGGGFDGETTVVDLDKGLAISVPKIEAFFGYGGAVGLRTLQGGFEVNYQRYRHDVSWTALGLTTHSNATVEYVNIALKRCWLPREQIQPVLHLGWIPYSRVNVTDGMLTPRGLSDTRYRGTPFGFNGGLGLLVHLGERLSAEGLALYRYVKYEQIEAVNGAGMIERADPISGNGFNGLIGLSWVLF